MTTTPDQIPAKNFDAHVMVHWFYIYDNRPGEGMVSLYRERYWTYKGDAVDVGSKFRRDACAHVVAYLDNLKFETIATLIRSKNAPSQKAAKMVLVNKIQLTEAAKKAQCSPQSASNTIRRFKKAWELIDTTWGNHDLEEIERGRGPAT